MTLTEIWNEIKRIRQGNTEADTNFEFLVTDWANRTLKEIWTGRGLTTSPNWWWLELTYTFNTVIDQMTYDLPTQIDGKKLESVRQKTTDRKLTYYNQRLFDKIVADESISSGTPEVYTIWGRDATTLKPYIRLFPVPDAAIAIYIRFYGNLTEYDSDSPNATNVELPSKYDGVLLDGILEKFYRQYPTYGDANTSLQSFLDGITKANEDNKSIDEEHEASSHGAQRWGYPRFSYPVPE